MFFIKKTRPPREPRNFYRKLLCIQEHPTSLEIYEKFHGIAWCAENSFGIHFGKIDQGTPIPYPLKSSANRLMIFEISVEYWKYLMREKYQNGRQSGGKKNRGVRREKSRPLYGSRDSGVLQKPQNMSNYSNSGRISYSYSKQPKIDFPRMG